MSLSYLQLHILPRSVRQHPDHIDSDAEVLLQVTHQHLPGEPRHGGPPSHRHLPPSQGGSGEKRIYKVSPLI